MEQLQREYARTTVDYIALVEKGRFRGLSSRRALANLLASRFGFALHERSPALAHALPAPLVCSAQTALPEVLQRATARPDEHFFDDVVLVGPSDRYLGLVPMRVLMRLQTEMLLGQISEVERGRALLETKQRQMEEDLRMARAVQLALMPQAQSRHTVGEHLIDCCHRYRPAGGVSGDFFEILPFEAGGLGLLVCDVMGHGVRSALITGMLKAFVESNRQLAREPGPFLSRLNSHLTPLLRQTGETLFVTAAYTVLEPESRSLRYAQAGHPPALVSRTRARASALVLPPVLEGPALGFLDTFEYLDAGFSFEIGDRILLYTDGYVEARNEKEDELGLEGLLDSLASDPSISLDGALTFCIHHLDSFVGNQPPQDDICLLGAEFLS